MPTTPSDVIHVAHLIVTTIPVTADDSSGLVMLDFATPISRTHRMPVDVTDGLFDIDGKPITYPVVLDLDTEVEALADWEQEILDDIAANPEPPAPEPKPKAKTPKVSKTKAEQTQRGGRRLRYLPVSGPSANYPPPGAWTNIDDPNEHHQVKE